MSLSKLSRLTAMANMHPNWNRSYYKNSRTAVMETEPVDWKYNTRENNMTSSWRLCNLYYLQPDQPPPHAINNESINGDSHGAHHIVVQDDVVNCSSVWQTVSQQNVYPYFSTSHYNYKCHLPMHSLLQLWTMNYSFVFCRPRHCTLLCIDCSAVPPPDLQDNVWEFQWAMASDGENCPSRLLKKPCAFKEGHGCDCTVKGSCLKWLICWTVPSLDLQDHFREEWWWSCHHDDKSIHCRPRWPIYQATCLQFYFYGEGKLFEVIVLLNLHQAYKTIFGRRTGYHLLAAFCYYLFVAGYLVVWCWCPG